MKIEINYDSPDYAAGDAFDELVTLHGLETAYNIINLIFSENTVSFTLQAWILYRLHYHRP